MNVLTFVVVLGVTTVVGYAAERSRFCSVSGIRDFFLFNDNYLTFALPGIFVGALGSFAILSRLGFTMRGFPLLLNSPGISSTLGISLVIIGGIGIGFYSILADGCPVRQHVRAAMGRRYSIAYLVGFYAGILYFEVVGIALVSFLYTLVV